MDTPRDIVAARRYVIDRFHRKNCAPTVVIDMDAEIDKTLAWVEGLNAARPAGTVAITLTHAILKATAMGLREHIFYNYGYNGRYRIVPHDEIDLSVPIEVRGAPAFVVVPGTDRLSVPEIARVFSEGAAAARSSGEAAVVPLRRIEEIPLLAGAAAAVQALARAATSRIPALEDRIFERHRKVVGTFPVNDVHDSKVTAMHGQLAYPHFAGLSILGLRDDVVVQGGAPRVRRVLPLALEFDHKLVDAGVGAKFLAAVKHNLEDPEGHLV